MGGKKRKSSADSNTCFKNGRRHGQFYAKNLEN